jgi:hypothetical protein
LTTLGLLAILVPSIEFLTKVAEFTGRPFQSMFNQNGIHQVPMTVKNPQANAVCEQMHQTIKDLLSTICHSNPPQNVATAINLVNTVLVSACYTSWTAVHQSLGVSPGALVFGHGMGLPIPVLTNYNLIRECHKTLINRNNLRKNGCRHFRDYEVMIKNPNPAGVDTRGLGPFILAQVHVNGTVTIEHLNNLFERINIRCLHPYCWQYVAQCSSLACTAIGSTDSNESYCFFPPKGSNDQPS